METTADLEAQIQAELAARRGVLNLARKESYSHALEVGRLLALLKNAVKHGEFLPALTRCGLSERSAQRYIRLQTRHVADLTESPTTIRGVEADYRLRHAAENLHKVRAVDPELADKVDAGEVSLRDAMAQTRAERIHRGKTPKGTIPLDTRSDEEREAAATAKHEGGCASGKPGHVCGDLVKSMNKHSTTLIQQLGAFGGAEKADWIVEALRLCVEVGERASKILATFDKPEPPKPKKGRRRKAKAERPSGVDDAKATAALNARREARMARASLPTLATEPEPLKGGAA